MDIKQELLNGLRDIREEIGTMVVLEFTNHDRGQVPAIVYKPEFNLTAGGAIVFEDKLMVNILVQDLVDRGLPIRGIIHLTVRGNPTKYTVTQNPLSSWDTVLVLECKGIKVPVAVKGERGKVGMV